MVGAIRRAGKPTLLAGMAFGAVAVSLSIPLASGCEWGYVIWGIRSKPPDPLFQFVRNGKAGYIDASGRVVIQPGLLSSELSLGEFHEGLLSVKKEHGYQYVDRSGNVAFSSDAWLAFDFSEGLAPASRLADSPRGTVPRWGFTDRIGRFAVLPQYFWVDPFSEGLARVSVSGEIGSTGYIDADDKFVIPPRLSYGRSFHDGRAAVIIGGPCQIVNGGSCGRAEFRPMTATHDCRFAFIDKTGEPVSDLRFDDADDFSEGLAPVRVGERWGYVDRSGRISIPVRFQSAEPFSEGLAVVDEGGKFGFIDHAGNFVIAPRFEAAESFSDGRALVSKSHGAGRWISRFIDRSGNAAFPGEFSAATSFSYGLAHVALRGKNRFAWINTSGNPVFSYISAP